MIWVVSCLNLQSSLCFLPYLTSNPVGLILSSGQWETLIVTPFQHSQTSTSPHPNPGSVLTLTWTVGSLSPCRSPEKGHRDACFSYVSGQHF